MEIKEAMATSLNGYRKECPLCGKMFVGRTMAREFCSEECRRYALRERQRKANYKTQIKRRNKKRMPTMGKGIMPLLKDMSPDELLRYGKIQTAQYIKYERGE